MVKVKKEFSDVYKLFELTRKQTCCVTSGSYLKMILNQNFQAFLKTMALT